MNENLPISALRESKVLYEGDLYELACVVLKGCDVLESGTRTKRRPTVNGLAKSYARLMNLDSEPLLRSLEQQGLPLGAVLDYDVIEAV